MNGEMEKKEIESLVEAVTESAFNVVKSAYDFQKEPSGASSTKDVGTRAIFKED